MHKEEAETENVKRKKMETAETGISYGANIVWRRNMQDI